MKIIIILSIEFTVLIVFSLLLIRFIVSLSYYLINLMSDVLN